MIIPRNGNVSDKSFVHNFEMHCFYEKPLTLDKVIIPH